MASGPEIDWRVHAFGLVATVGLLATVIFAIRGRLAKTESQYKHSHESDWMFLILLLVVVTTGVLQFALHRSGLDVAANIAYVDPPDGGRADARARGAVQQVVASRLPSAGDVLPRGARSGRDGSRAVR